MLDTLLVGPDSTSVQNDNAMQIDDVVNEDMDDAPILPDIPITENTLAHPAIPSLGLW